MGEKPIMMISRIARVVALATVTTIIAACSPEVGSEEWCNDLKKKPKMEWTAQEAKDFAKHCVLR